MPEYELSYSDFELSINFVTAAAIEGKRKPRTRDR